MKTRIFGLALLGLMVASGARAQAWDAPSFLPPRPGDDIGVYLTDVADFGIQGIWRQQGNLNLGLRLGYIDTPGDGVIVVAGESWDLLTAAGPTFPLDVAWTLGVGAAFNGGTTFEVPLGLSIGRVIDLEGVTLQPYAHPRIGLFVRSYDNGTGENDGDLDLDILFDLGVDAVLNENLKLRLGAAFGATDAVGVGIAFRWSRGAVVR